MFGGGIFADTVSRQNFPFQTGGSNEKEADNQNTGGVSSAVHAGKRPRL